MSIIGFYMCEYESYNKNAIKNIITFYHNHKDMKDDGNDKEIFFYGTNLYFVRCFQTLWATIYLFVFFQSDNQYIIKKNAYKGAVISTLISLLVGWLFFQGQEVSIKRNQLSITQGIRVKYKNLGISA